MLFSAEHRIFQSSAVGKDNMIETPDRVTRLGREDVDGDYVAGHDRSLAPTHQPERLRRGRLGNPMYDVAVRILHIEINKGVGIGPGESRHRCSLQLGKLVLIGWGSVVCEQSARNTEHHNGASSRHKQLTPHLELPPKPSWLVI